jgi:hypothetical protein
MSDLQEVLELVEEKVKTIAVGKDGSIRLKNSHIHFAKEAPRTCAIGEMQVASDLLGAIEEATGVPSSTVFSWTRDGETSVHLGGLPLSAKRCVASTILAEAIRQNIGEFLKNVYPKLYRCKVIMEFGEQAEWACLKARYKKLYLDKSAVQSISELVGMLNWNLVYLKLNEYLQSEHQVEKGFLNSPKQFTEGKAHEKSWDLAKRILEDSGIYECLTFGAKARAKEFLAHL